MWFGRVDICLDIEIAAFAYNELIRQVNYALQCYTSIIQYDKLCDFYVSKTVSI